MAKPRPCWTNLNWLKGAARECIILFIAAWVLIRQKRGAKSWASLLGLCALRLKFGARIPRNDTMSGCLPFIGNQLKTMEVLRRGVSPMAKDELAKYGYKNLEMNGVMGVNILMLVDPTDLKYVLKDNWNNFSKNYNSDLGFDVNFEEVLGEGVFAVDGDKWKVHRKVASHMFSITALKSKMEDVFRASGEQLVGALKQLKKQGSTFDLQNLFACLTFDTMCEIAFGVSPHALEMASTGKKPEFLTSFDFSQTVSLLRMLRPPKLWKAARLFGVGEEGEMPAHIQSMQDYLQEIVKKRRKEMEQSDGVDRGDLLSLYIAHGMSLEDPDARERMLSDKYLKDMIMNFMIAGRDTTSCLMTNLFKLLTENKDERDQLRDELQAVQGVDHDTLVGKTPFADACINEALRMFPPVGTDARYCQKSDVLPSGTEVMAGTLVGIPNYALGRNPNLFKNPNQFDPSRWSEGDKIHKTHEYQIPVFWAGNRLCLGKDMARFEAKVVSAHLLRADLEFELVDSPELAAAQAAGEEFSQSPVMFYRHGVMARVV